MKTEKSLLWQLQAQCQEKGGICAKCKREVNILTVDHIIPQSFTLSLDNGRWISNNDAENFQLLCQPCNKMKGASWDFTDDRTIKLLMKYLKPYLK
jgi:5-methylcytosine-specific restriction endonuclease McrA